MLLKKGVIIPLLYILAAGSERSLALSLEDLQKQIKAMQVAHLAYREQTEAELKNLRNQIAALRSVDTALAENTIVPSTAFPTRDHRPSLNPSNSDDRVLQVYGDLQVRYEYTDDHMPGSRNRNRGVMRGRLGAKYQVADSVTIGARLVTGSSDDPNTSHVTLTDWDNDFEVSLDRAYISYSSTRLQVSAGNVSNPFVTTDMLWDGDVNPHGIWGKFSLFQGRSWSLGLTSMYNIINEETVAEDSSMLAGQFSAKYSQENWSASAHLAYYDYDIGNLLGSDGGDTRENNLTADGTAYLSDFGILDFNVLLQMDTGSVRWPLSAGVNFLKNLDATVSEDTGYALRLGLGNNNKIGDLGFGYAYTYAEKDAVFAANSNDNYSYATNYEAHGLSVHYWPTDKTQLQLVGYNYRRLAPELELLAADEWVPRIRLNLTVKF